MEQVKKSAEERMHKAIAALEKDFSGVRSGRAGTALVENIKADYYGTPTPIGQIGSIAVPDSRTITIQPWDKKAFGPVEKADVILYAAQAADLKIEPEAAAVLADEAQGSFRLIHNFVAKLEALAKASNLAAIEMKDLAGAGFGKAGKKGGRK